MLFSALVDEVITEVGGDVDDSDLSDKVLGFTKSALRRFPRFARNRMIRAKKSGSLSAAAQTMSVPSGVVDILALFFEDSGTGKRRDIPRPGLRIFNEAYTSSGSGYPNFAIIRTNTVEFDRPADQAYTIYFEVNQEIDDIAAGDTVAFSSDRIEILKDGIKYYYYKYVEDAELREESKAVFKGGLDELKKEYQREEMPDHVEEGE